MFDEVRQAVEKLETLCNVTSKTFEIGKPLKNTEVYNEGWLLRLVVSKLCDIKGEMISGSIADKGFEEAAAIGRLATRGWCSEGVLSPTFEGEGATKADGIVGDVILRPKTKWGFSCTAGDVLMLEAKINSSLSPRVDHLAKLNQAARYIAIIARLMCASSNAKGRLMVLASPGKVSGIDETIQNVPLCIERIVDENGFHKNVVGISREQFLKNVAEVTKVSHCVSWDDLLARIPWGSHAAFVQKYYHQVLLANKN